MNHFFSPPAGRRRAGPLDTTLAVTGLILVGLLGAAAEAFQAPAGADAPADAEASGQASPTASPGEAAAGPLAPDVRIELETVSGRSSLRPGPLSLLALQNGSAGRVITFGEHRCPVEDALFLRFPERPLAKAPTGAIPNPWIVLFRTGETLRAGIDASADAAAQDILRLRTDSLGDRPVEVPLGAITALIPERALYGRPGRLQDAAQARSQLIRRLERMNVEEDVVLLRQDSAATGPRGSKIEGIVEKLTGDSLTISADRLGEVEVSYSRLNALVLARLEGPGEEDQRETGVEESSKDSGAVRVQLDFQDGSSLSAQLLALGEGRARIRHAVLGDVEIRLEYLAGISFLGGRVSFLSDREPIHVEEYPGPLFDQTDRYAYKRDRNVLFGPLRMGGRIYRKGLGVHAHSLIEYALTADDGRFQATIGLDDSARPLSTAVAAADVASVVFRVKVDEELLFEKAMSWRDAPEPVSVPIKGGRKLSLEVDFGGVEGSMNSTLDRANWAEARVVKSP